MFTEAAAQKVIESFLTEVRLIVRKNSLNVNRLPQWVQGAKVRVGWVNYSLIMVFEDSYNGDQIQCLGKVGADTVVLFNSPNFEAKAASLNATQTESFVIMQGEYGKEGASVLNLAGPPGAFFNCGFNGYHGPNALLNLFFQKSVNGEPQNVVAMRFVPFAFYVHLRDCLQNRFWGLCEDQIVKLLTDIHGSSLGDYYEQLAQRSQVFVMNKETGVIVLGKDTGNELNELEAVRDYIRSKGYTAELIKNLPEIPMMSNEEKVRLWCLCSRFCVMVDRIPTGHISEYVMLREQRSILGFLRQRGTGSTYMIGDDSLVDINHINVFEFDSSPLAVLDEVVKWSEELASKRIAAYKEAYPWRA